MPDSVPVHLHIQTGGIASNQFLWAAGRQQRWWWQWRCRQTLHYKDWWSWFVLPESSESPPDSSPLPQTQLSLVSRAAADQLVSEAVVWSPAASSRLTLHFQLSQALVPVVPVLVAGTLRGTRSFCFLCGDLLRLKQTQRASVGLCLLCPGEQRFSVRRLHSEQLWDCQWVFGARPAGSDGFQPGLSGLPAGSLDLSGPPAADSSAPAEETREHIWAEITAVLVKIR